MANRKILPHIALVAVALIYGANYLIAKNVMNDGYIQPFGFIVMRVIFGAVALSLFHSIFIKEKIALQDLKHIVLCAITGIAANMLAFFKGLELTSTVHSSIIMTLTPIFVMVFAYLILGEKLTQRKLLGVSIGFVGALTLILATQKGDTVSTIEGDILILVNALFYSLYLVLVRRLKSKYDTITVVKWAFICAVPLVIPFGGKQLMQVQWSTFDTSVWLAVVYVLVATTFLAYLFNAFAISRLQATTVGTYVYLQPIIANVIAALFSNEIFGWVHLACTACIFVGVYFVSSKAKSRTI